MQCKIGQKVKSTKSQNVHKKNSTHSHAHVHKNIGELAYGRTGNTKEFIVLDGIGSL